MTIKQRRWWRPLVMCISSRQGVSVVVSTLGSPLPRTSTVRLLPSGPCPRIKVKGVLIHGGFAEPRAMDDEETEHGADESENGETAAETPERVASSSTLVDIPVIPFEPPTTGSGHDIGEKQGKLRTAILERVSQGELSKFKEALKGHLVTITLGFFLWKGSTKTTNTRAVKGLDNLMKIIFDVLGKGQQGLGLLEEESYICEVYAKTE